jgi:hypothetical protein
MLKPAPEQASSIEVDFRKVEYVPDSLESFAITRTFKWRGGTTMRKTIRYATGILILLCLAAAADLRTPSTHAKTWGFTNSDLCGSYASQLSGTVNFPAAHPWSMLNGPYALTGRVTADGLGNAEGTVYDNYNGLLIPYSWTGTYEVNRDGTVNLTATADMPGIGTLSLIMFGVLCEEGKQMRLMWIGPTFAPGRVGATITGSWTRQ